MTTLHPKTFDYYSPTQEQITLMAEMRVAAKKYADTIEAVVPDGPDRTYIIRKLREVAMWVNLALTRQPDGTPRNEGSQ